MPKAHGDFYSMTLSAILWLAASPAAAGGLLRVEFAQLRIETREIVRVRPVPPPRINLPKPRWTEKKGPDCIQVDTIAGALVAAPDSIDLILKGNIRMRAKLEKSCPSIDFYMGFYVKPTRDGRVCKGRDLIYSRAGGNCEIDKFRTLVPAK